MVQRRHSSRRQQAFFHHLKNRRRPSSNHPPEPLCFGSRLSTMRASRLSVRRSPALPFRHRTLPSSHPRGLPFRHRKLDPMHSRQPAPQRRLQIRRLPSSEPTPSPQALQLIRPRTRPSSRRQAAPASNPKKRAACSNTSAAVILELAHLEVKVLLRTTEQMKIATRIWRGV